MNLIAELRAERQKKRIQVLQQNIKQLKTNIHEEENLRISKRHVEWYGNARSFTLSMQINQ